MREATGTDAISSLWIGLIATPRATIAGLEQACKATLEVKETVDIFTKQLQPVTFRGAEWFGKHIAAELDRAREVMAAAGTKAH